MGSGGGGFILGFLKKGVSKQVNVPRDLFHRGERNPLPGSGGGAARELSGDQDGELHDILWLRMQITSEIELEFMFYVQ